MQTATITSNIASPSTTPSICESAWAKLPFYPSESDGTDTPVHPPRRSWQVLPGKTKRLLEIAIDACIRALLYDIEEIWGDVEIYCPLVCRMLNSIPVESTGYAPPEILVPGMSVNTKLASMRLKKMNSIYRVKCDEYL